MFGRANACEPPPRIERWAAAAVILAIIVSLAGACVVIVESAPERPQHRHLVIASAE